MSNPTTFINTYTNNIMQLCQLLATLRTNNDQLEQDPTLITRYFTDTIPPYPPPRDDITEADVKNAQSAITQMLFTFDSGAPTQKSYLFKMMP